MKASSYMNFSCHSCVFPASYFSCYYFLYFPFIVQLSNWGDYTISNIIFGYADKPVMHYLAIEMCTIVNALVFL